MWGLIAADCDYVSQMGPHFSGVGPFGFILVAMGALLEALGGPLGVFGSSLGHLWEPLGGPGGCLGGGSVCTCGAHHLLGEVVWGRRTPVP